jgi:hypothetical protein
LSRTNVLNLEQSSGAQTAANLEHNTLSSRTNSISASPQLNGLVSLVTLIWRQGLEDEKIKVGANYYLISPKEIPFGE